jgi:hypothetical protein
LAWTDRTNIKHFWNIVLRLAEASPPTDIMVTLQDKTILKGRIAGLSTVGNSTQQTPIPTTWKGTLKLVTKENTIVDIDYLDIEKVDFVKMVD